MGYSHTVGGHTYSFNSLKELLAKATPARSGDYLAEIAAGDDEERVAAQMALADLPLKCPHRGDHSLSRATWPRLPSSTNTMRRP